MLKICEFCKKEFECKKSKRKFCSSKCSNEKRKLILIKTCGFCEKTFKADKSKRIYCSISCSNASRRNDDFKPRMTREEWRLYNKEKTLKRLFETPFDELSWDSQRRRVILEQKELCEGCGISEWRGEKLTLEVDHKDGNKNNNKRENLEALCPNCHSLTPTWRGRNKNNNDSSNGKVNDEEMMVALLETKNKRQALMSLGLSAKGGNYKRAKELEIKIKALEQLIDKNNNDFSKDLVDRIMNKKGP